MISIVLSTDANGLQFNATLLASILRRTRAEVSVRIYTRGFSVPSFSRDRLSVEFVRSDEPVEGAYPRHVSEAVFDRLRIIRDDSGWDRVLVLDHDMIVLCDLAEYFEEDLGDNLLAGRLFGPGNNLALQMAPRGGLPDAWSHCGDYPYFFMGPMMNLAAMRRAGTWKKLLAAHSAIAQDEQMSLTAATDGRVKAVGKKWNLVPQWDKLEEIAMDLPVWGRVEHDGLIWQNRVPQGIIHWTGWHKPWHHQSNVWRADLWEAERTSWEQLRMGLWEKPLATEIEPSDFAATRALVRRGWRVSVVTGDLDQCIVESEAAKQPHPDLEWIGARERSELRAGMLGKADMVRFGSGVPASRWIQTNSQGRENLVLQGPASAVEVSRLKELGYRYEARLTRKEWPTGGPHPKAVECFRQEEALAVAFDQDVYLSKSGSDGQPNSTHAGEEARRELPLLTFIEERLPAWVPEPRQILLLGAGHAREILSRVYPEAAILCVEHDVERYQEWNSSFDPSSNFRVVHCPLDPILPWYDLSAIELPPSLDLVLVGGPASRFPVGMREASVSLRMLMKKGGAVVVQNDLEASGKSCEEEWTQIGWETVCEVDGVSVLQQDLDEASSPSKPSGSRAFDFHRLAELTFVISLPAREDRREALRKNWSHMGLSYHVVDGVRPEPSEVRWDEMKGMEAYGKFEWLRGNYVLGAVGCKRAGIKALKAFLESKAETALICQDDCRWQRNAPALISKAMAELPPDWDLLYFSASGRNKHLPWSPHLVKLRGARLCTSILWTRVAAERLLPELEACDCEWDVLMQRNHQDMNAYCVVPMPAYQARSKSDIIEGMIQPPNR